MRLFLYCFIFPNLFFGLLKETFYLERAFFNMDYLLILVLLYFYQKKFWLWAFLFTIIFLLDLLNAFAPSFNFTDISYVFLLDNTSFLKDFVFLIFRAFLLIVLIYGYFLLSRYFITQMKKMHFVVVLVVGISIAFMDFAYSNNTIINSQEVVSKYNWGTSGLLKTYHAQKAYINNLILSHHLDYQKETTGASSILINKIQQNAKLPQNIFLIVVESLGVLKDEKAHLLQFENVLNSEIIKNNFEIKLGTVAFHGSTVAGEMRELCQFDINGSLPAQEMLQHLSCLPELMKKQGYQTLALHGFNRYFYHRYLWYPSLGFDAVYFRRELREKLAIYSKCGISFPGPCSEDVLNGIHKIIQQNPDEKHFVYYLTLNAHLPLGKWVQELASFDCSRNPVIYGNEAVCLLVSIHHHMFEKLANLMENVFYKNSAWIIVGDHAPPFVQLETRKHFSYEEVPYLILWPKISI